MLRCRENRAIRNGSKLYSLEHPCLIRQGVCCKCSNIGHWPGCGLNDKHVLQFVVLICVDWYHVNNTRSFAPACRLYYNLNLSTVFVHLTGRYVQCQRLLQETMYLLRQLGDLPALPLHQFCPIRLGCSLNCKNNTRLSNVPLPSCSTS